MHADYYFYAPTKNIDEAVSAYEEWAKECCDENNWWTMLYAVNSDGERRVLTEEGDWRGRDKYAAAEISKGPTVETLWKKAWKACAWEVELFEEWEWDEADKIPLERWPAFFLTTLLEKIREMYDELLPNLICGEESDLWKHYLRRRRTRYFERIFFDLHLYHDGNPPFVKEGTPYDFRAFDLTPYVEEEDDEAVTILVVDIHT